MSNNSLFGTRVAEPRLRQTALQPAGIPGSTYVRPQEYEAGTNLNALASALGGLNTALSGFAARQKQKAEDPNDEDNRLWIARRQQMTMEELQSEATNGTADGIRARQDALDALLGERANADFRNRWTGFYNTEFDKTGGDMQAEYDRMRQEYAGQLPSEISRGNFYRLTGPHFEQWQAEDTKAKVGFVKDQIGTTVVQSFRTANEDMQAAGKSAQERADAIFAMSASNRTFLEMSGQEQNDTIFALATEYALKGDEELVGLLLRGTRKGADGAALPSLSSIPRYSTDTIKLIEQAQSVREANAKETGYHTFVAVADLVRDGKFTDAEARKHRGTGLYSDGELSGLVGQSTNNRLSAENRFLKEQAERQARLASEQAETGLLASAFMETTHMNGTRRIEDKEIVSFDGKSTRTITRQQQIDGAVSIFEDAMASQERVWVEQQGMDAVEAARRTRQQKLMWYSQNGIENREWSDILNGIAPRVTVEVLLERGDVSKQIGQQAELYRELMAANPAYLSTMLTDGKSKAFLETYALAVENRRMPKEDALHFAATQVAQPEHIKVQSLLTPSETDRLVSGVLRDLGYDERATNVATVRQRVIEMSLNNFTEREIKDRLRTEIDDTSIEIHGMLVQDHRDLPKDFPGLIEAELQAAFEVFGPRYGITDVNDLYVIPVSGQSKWQIASKSLGGMPIGTSYVTPQSLDVRRQRINRDHDALVLQQLQASEAERAAYQARYDASIADMEGMVDKYRRGTGKLSPAIADYLQGVLDDRLERDRILREMTPEKVQEEIDRVRTKTDEFDLNGYGVGLGAWSPVTAPPM